MTKIVFVNRFFFPDYSATSQLLTDLSFDLAGNGWKVVVITSRQLYEDASAKLPRHEWEHGVEVRRAWSTSFGRVGLFGRMIDYLSFYIGAVLVMNSVVRKGDILVVKTDPPLMSWFAALVAKYQKAQLVNWVQDIFPEIAVAVGFKALPGWLLHLLLKLRDRAWLVAAKNVVLGKRMQYVLVSRGVDERKIRAISNWADGNKVHPVEPVDNHLRKEWGLEGKFVVGYSGNMGRAHEFKTLLKIAAHFKGNPDILFLFIGGGAFKHEIEKEAVTQGIDNIMFKGYQDQQSLSCSLSVADVHWISLRPELEGLIVPSKFYGIAAVGRPVLFIGDKNGEIPVIIREARCGLTIGVGAVDDGVQFLTELMIDENLRKDMGSRIRRVFDEKYDKRHALAAWSEELEVLSGCAK